MRRWWWLVALILFYVGMTWWMRQVAIDFLRTGEIRYAVNLVGTLVFTISGTISFLLGSKRASQPAITVVLIVVAFAGFWLVDYPRSLEKLGVLLILVTLVPIVGIVLLILGRGTVHVVAVTVLVSLGIIGVLTATSSIDVAAALYAAASVLVVTTAGYLGYILREAKGQIM